MASYDTAGCDLIPCRILVTGMARPEPDIEGIQIPWSSNCMASRSFFGKGLEVYTLPASPCLALSETAVLLKFVQKLPIHEVAPAAS